MEARKVETLPAGGSMRSTTARSWLAGRRHALSAPRPHRHNGSSMETQRVTVALIDRSGGYEASSERVRLAALADFAADVETFLRGAGKEIDPAEIDVAVRAGSLAIETQPLPPSLTLFRDLQSLGASELLDRLDVKRKEVLERWQKAARATSELAYRITAPLLTKPVVISADTDFRANDSDEWVEVERYVQGEIVDLGGKTKANAHVRLPDGTTLKITTQQQVLRDEQANRLYKQATLRVRAQYNVLTKELRDARLVEFVEYAPSFDEAEFEKLTRKGREAWKDVGDATAWVEGLRGGDD